MMMLSKYSLTSLHQHRTNVVPENPPARPQITKALSVDHESRTASKERTRIKRAHSAESETENQRHRDVADCNFTGHASCRAYTKKTSSSAKQLTVDAHPHRVMPLAVTRRNDSERVTAEIGVGRCLHAGCDDRGGYPLAAGRLSSSAG
jgi:hypothetical protein